MLPSNHPTRFPSGSGQQQTQQVQRSYYQPRADQAPLNLESASTIGDSVDMSCDTQTSVVDSLWSYDSTRDIDQYVREVNGRRFNAQNSTYILPSDPDEYSRLDKQHLTQLLGLGGLYAATEQVRAALAPGPGVQRAILDLGFGTGNWAIAMALEFPHARVVAVDLAPSAIDHPPPNCAFELDDINRGLAHFYGRFDVVHMRSVGSGLRDYSKAIEEIARCLRPGGVALFVDGDMHLVKEDMDTFQEVACDACPSGSWMQRYFHEARQAQVNRTGCGKNSPEQLDAGLWDHPMFDPQTCGAGGCYTPLGPWATSSNPDERQKLSMVGTMMRQNIKEFLRGARQLLLEEGIPKHILDEWTEAADYELDTTKFRNWLRFRYAWGQTPSPDNIPIPSHISSPTSAPQAFKGMALVPSATTTAHTEYDGPVRGLWGPPRPSPRYQQFKNRTREEAAMDMARRHKLIRDREILIDGPTTVKPRYVLN